MAGGWGSKKNGIRIGAFWDGIQISGDGSQARITDPRVAIDRDVNIVDSSNSLSWSGGAVTDGSDSNLNLDGSGEKRIKNVSGQWQDLEYGSTKTATFSATLSGVNYAGGTLTVSKSVTFPVRAIDPPAAPTGLSATVNAATNTASIAWTNNATTSAPYTSLKLERSSNGGATWVSIPVTGTPTSFSDTGLAGNSRYRYRIAAVNSSGSSTYTTMTTDGYTTPSAPSSCSAAKDSSGNIVVSWLDNSAHETGFEVWHSSNGGTSWDVPPLTTRSAGATSWTHASPNTGTTHTYRIRAVLGGLVSGYSTQSNTVQLLTKPLAPTLLGPSSGSALNTAISNTFSWRHNSADTTAQTAYELRHQYSTDGGTSWSAYTTLVGSTDQFRALPAGTFTPGRLYKWNVRTKGQHADFSDWSTDFTFVATTAPSAAWVSPTNGGIVATATVTAQWTYADAESEPQSRYRLTLVDENGNTIETIDTASAATSQAMSTILGNNRTYTLHVQVWDSNDMASDVASATFQTSFLTPAPATFVDAVWDHDTGSVAVSWVNPDPVDIGYGEGEYGQGGYGGSSGYLSTTHNSVLRSEDGGVTWETIATDLPTNSTVVDYGPKLDTDILYRVVSFSSVGTVAMADIESSVHTRNSGQWVFFNVGPAWATWAKVRIAPEYDLEFERVKEVHQFARRDDSVELIGHVRNRTMAFSAVIEPYVEQDAMDALLYIADQEAPIMYRDTRGRKWFVSIGPVKLSTKGLTTFSTQLTYVGRRNVG